MAKNTTLKTRIQNRHDTEANWTTASNATNPFIPLKGEVIVYDPDTTYTTPRVKIGDGVTKVGDLAFVGGDISKYVTLDTEQTISGNKTFSKAVSVSTDSTAGFEITGGGNAWKFNARTLEGPLNIEGSGASGSNTYQFPNKTGTIALTSDIPSTNNFVTLAGDQTITGAKTFNETTDFGNGVSVGITDSTDRINIGVDSENHAGIIEFASEAVVGCTLTLPDRSGTIAILDDIPSTNNLVTTDTAQTISGAKTFKSNLIVGTPSTTSVTLSSNGKISNFQGIRGFDIDPSNFYIQAQQYGAYQRLKFSTSLGVVSANTYTIDVPVVDGTMLTSGNTKTIGGQSIEGSGDISVGDNETKVQFGDIIDHSSLQTTHNVTLNTDASNLQDKTITALWVRLINDTTNNVGYSYQIPIQDLYNFRDTSSSTLGAFSFLLAMPGSRWNLTFAKNSSVNITTMFMNGTLNYSIPLSLKMNGSTHPGSGVLLGFVYKGNKFAGSEVY